MRCLPRAWGIEVGVGTGRFAAPLGVRLGVEPARQMAQRARARGIAVCQALGEQMPFRSNQFDYVLLITVDCFVKEVRPLLVETARILKAHGRLILAMIDGDSPLGQMYEAHKEEDPFYRVACLHSAREIVAEVERAGFHITEVSQTILGLPPAADTNAQCGQAEFDTETFAIQPGYGQGAFVVFLASKTPS